MRKEEYKLIVVSENSTDLDYNPASIIRSGDKFEDRLTVLFKEHYGEDITKIDLAPHRKIPHSYNCKVTMAGFEENFVLLRSWEY